MKGKRFSQRTKINWGHVHDASVIHRYSRPLDEALLTNAETAYGRKNVGFLDEGKGKYALFSIREEDGALSTSREITGNGDESRYGLRV